jgi:predicted nucleic acid-binding protein
VRSLLATLPVFGLDEPSAQVFGQAKALLERQGQRLADADLFLATTSDGSLRGARGVRGGATS